jgi:26S proteasome regulatory subunit N10
MILLDNSEYMRNGDYPPTRLSAQEDSATMLAGMKLRDNAESTVGVMTMGIDYALWDNENKKGGASGGGGDMLVSPTTDLGKVLR